MSSFKAKRVSRTYVQRNNATPEKVFPLICPVREKEWAPYFDSEIIYSETGIAEKYCIFTTPQKSHENGSHSSPLLWIVTGYDAINYFIEMMYIRPELELVILRINLKANHDGTTSTTITSTHTGLSPKGNNIVMAFTEEKHNFGMKQWEKAINFYIDTGKLIPESELYAH